MSVKIHHGPPGSYKTSGAVAEDFVQAVKSGRTVITNVRGLKNKKRIVRVLKKHAKLTEEAAKKFEIINLDTSLEVNREKMRTFFHWAPKGAYFLIDEINTIYPKQWREAQLKNYDFPGGTDAAQQQKRPVSITEAFEMHRHQNWDFSITTPSITKVHEIVKSITEVSYLHQNKATIGIKGSYWEIMHYADNTGKATQDQLLHTTKKIKKWVFELYESTATGDVTDSIAGRNVFTQPKVIAVALLLISFFIWGFFSASKLIRKYTGSETESPPVTEKTQNTQNKRQNEKIRETNINANIHGSNSGTSPENDNSGPNREMKFVDLILAGDMFYIGNIGKKRLIETDGKIVEARELEKRGVKIKKIAKCFYELKHKKNSIIIQCKKHIYEDDDSIVDNLNPF